MPFKEDVANWSFPSLDRIHTTTGRPVKEHRLLPKQDLLNAMDAFVDAMMLPTYEVDDGAGGDESMQVEENGEQAKATEPWFSPEAAYNPSIHNMRNVMIKKILNPDAKFDNETVPESIARYMMLPPEIEESAASAAEALRIAADLKKGTYFDLAYPKGKD